MAGLMAPANRPVDPHGVGRWRTTRGGEQWVGLSRPVATVFHRDDTGHAIAEPRTPSWFNINEAFNVYARQCEEANRK